MTEQASYSEKTYLDLKTEQLAGILQPFFTEHMTEEERDAVENILSIGAGDAIEAPILTTTFKKAQVTLLEIDEQLANLTKRKFASNERIRSLHIDAASEDAKVYYDADIFIVRNPNIDKVTEEWNSIFHHIAEKMPDKGLLLITSDLEREMEAAEQIVTANGLVFRESPQRTGSRMLGDHLLVSVGRQQNSQHMVK